MELSHVNWCLHTLVRMRRMWVTLKRAHFKISTENYVTMSRQQPCNIMWNHLSQRNKHYVCTKVPISTPYMIIKVKRNSSQLICSATGEWLANLAHSRYDGYSAKNTKSYVNL